MISDGAKMEGGGGTHLSKIYGSNPRELVEPAAMNRHLEIYHFLMNLLKKNQNWLKNS